MPCSHGPAPKLSVMRARAYSIHQTTMRTLALPFTLQIASGCGPYRISVPVRRTKHLRFNEFSDPAPIPADTDYAGVVESTVPIVSQQTRLDSRQAENALFSTVAYPA